MNLYEERIRGLELTKEELVDLYNRELLNEPLCKKDKELQMKKLEVLSKLVKEI